MAVKRLAEGLWRWTAPHPDWREGTDWPRDVGSVYCETPEAIVLIDPLVPAGGGERERFWNALDRDVARLGRPVVVLVTCRSHVRSARDVRDRYAAPVWAPTADGEGLDDIVSDVLRDEGWPVGGVQAFLMGVPAALGDEAVYWLPAYGAVVPGDVLVGDGGGVILAPAAWYSDSPAEEEWFRTDLAPSLHRLAIRNPELILVSHGDPVTAGATTALLAALAAM